MDSEIITEKQLIAILTTFLIGSSLILGPGSQAGRDAWIAVAFAMLFTIPVYSIYGRIVSLFPGEGLFEIIILVFGKIIGKIIVLLFSGYVFFLGVLVIRDFTEFIKIVTLHNTPQFIIAFFFILLSIWASKSGIEVIGRWIAAVLPLILVAIFVVSVLLIPYIDLDNIKPILEDGIAPVLMPAFSVFSFPFTEVVAVLIVFGNLGKRDSPYKVLFWSLLIGGITILLVTLRSILTLGESNMSVLYFASYASVRLIHIGDFLERIEISVVIVFMLGGFVKISICLLAVCRGVARVMSFQKYRQIVAPIGLMMLLFSIFVFSSATEMFDWTENYYSYYAFPYEVFFPVIIWIGAEIKAQKLRSRNLPKA